MQGAETPNYLQKNLATLRKHQPGLCSTLQTALGETQSPKQTHNPMQDRNLARAVMHSLNQGMDFLYLIGVGSSEVLAYCTPEIISKNRGILVIEPSLQSFLQTLDNSDLTQLLKSKRIHWAIGEDLESQIQNLMDQTWCFLASKPMIHSGALPETPAEQTRSEAIVQFIKSYTEQQANAFQQHLQQLPERLKNHKSVKLKIWSYIDLRNKAGYSLIQHVLLRTFFYHFRQMGFECAYTVLKPNHYYPPYYRHYRMMKFQPDLIFLCNDSPAFETALGAELTRSLPIPKVVWYADDPIHAEHLFQRHGVQEAERFLVADYEWKDPIVEYGCKTPIAYLPGAATKTRRGKKRGSRKCDVVFVGQVRDQRQFFARLPTAWREWSEKVIVEKLRFPRLKIRDAIQKYPPPANLPQDRMDELRQKILWEANTRFRVQVMRPLLAYDTVIYGNKDWLAFLPPEAAQKSYRGILRFQHLFEVYRNAKITLNIHSLQSYTCLNVRDFDVPAAGGFLLSDWLPHADEIFLPGFVNDLPLESQPSDHHLGKDVFFYRSIPEMLALVDYFLHHEDERQHIIENARNKVINTHTYYHRAQWLKDYFNQLLQR